MDEGEAGVVAGPDQGPGPSAAAASAVTSFGAPGTLERTSRPSVVTMPIPEHVSWLRSHVGHEPLWLTGVTAIVLKHDAQRPEVPLVLLVQRSDDGRWTPVSGIVDPREHPADTAVREAMEETCVEIEVERLIAVRVVGPITYPNGDVSDYLDHTFRCRWVAGEPTVGDDEAVATRWCPVDDLPDMAADHAEMIRRAVADEVDPYLAPPPRP